MIMGLFDFLLGKPPAPDLQHLRQQDAQIEPDIHSEGDSLRYRRSIRIQTRNFYGSCTYSASANGRYTIAWYDGHSWIDEKGVCGFHLGCRDSGYGRYFLLEGNQILVEGKMARPNDGKVADNGTFILNDWGFGSGGKGIFCAFNVTGQKLITKKFGANLYNNGISSDGHFATCQTCEAESSDDSILTIFDLMQGTEICAWEPDSGWADYYEFIPDGIRLGYRNVGAFRYTMAGEFLERDIWQDAQLTKGDCENTLAMIERMIKQSDGKPSLELATKLIKGADRALFMVANADAKKQARAMKLRGICLDAQEVLQDALDCYDKALALDSKVGVKRRAEQIRKILSAETNGSQQERA